MECGDTTEGTDDDLDVLSSIALNTFTKQLKRKSTFFITLLIHEKFNLIQIFCLNINVNFRTISVHKYKIFTTPPSQRF